ncbi:MAG: glycosyltransferase [Actinobacteria bacterium]|nr:glycosyltransferase [Actinomycetota bacterium]
MEGERIERIAVVAPMLNEARHVENLAADLAAQDFAGEVACFVADGGSRDGSPRLLREAAERHGLDLTLLENPGRIAATGLNVAIRAALEWKPDLVVRLDCHSRYRSDYLRQAARVAEETGAWNVGGQVVPRGETRAQRAAAVSQTSPFGGANWTRASGRHEADTVYCGAFRPWVFERVGLYDEELPVGEVEDLNHRLRGAGGRIVYDPAMVVEYLPRETVRSTFVQYYRYGLWKAAVTAKHRRFLSARSSAPLVLVLGGAALGIAGARSRAARRVFAAGASGYAAAAFVFASRAVRLNDEDPALAPRVALYFPAYHLAHGLGGIHGWARVARRALSGARGPRRSAP